MGDEVIVKPGFARNHLIPSKKAVYATPNNQTQHIIEKTVSMYSNIEAKTIYIYMQGVQNHTFVRTQRSWAMCDSHH